MAAQISLGRYGLDTYISRPPSASTRNGSGRPVMNTTGKPGWSLARAPGHGVPVQQAGKLDVRQQDVHARAAEERHRLVAGLRLDHVVALVGQHSERVNRMRNSSSTINTRRRGAAAESIGMAAQRPAHDFVQTWAARLVAGPTKAISAAWRFCDGPDAGW